MNPSDNPQGCIRAMRGISVLDAAQHWSLANDQAITATIEY
jgi:hypothetical protein